MANPFQTPSMAAGYAASRPPVHPLVIERIRQRLQPSKKFERALDAGCGAGLSTRPLERLARHCFGIDQVEAMVKGATGTAPGAHFAASRAEALPFRARCFDLITAAGSLNYADPHWFFEEAARVLAPDGVLVIYDFSPGRTLRNSGSLDEWFAAFLNRYPWPPGEAIEINPRRLGELTSRFRVQSHEEFEEGLTLSPAAYLDYVMTETNVAYAARGGAPLEQIRSWCAEGLEPVFRGRAREILFRGYIAYMVPM